VTEYGLDTKIQVEFEVVDRLAADGDKKFKRVISKVQEEKAKRKAS
jgi:hypothetical protein